MYIILLTYIMPLEKVDKFGNEHIAFLDKFFEAGKFIVSGRQSPRTGGVIIAYNVSREELDEILKEDPFNKNGLANYSITEFVPVKYQQAFKSFL